MPKRSKLAEQMRRQRTGADDRIRKLAHNAAGETTYPIGDGTVYLKRHPLGGIHIGRAGRSRITLTAAETRQLVKLAQELSQ